MTFSPPPDLILLFSLLLVSVPIIAGLRYYYIKKLKYLPFKGWKHVDKHSKNGPTAECVAKHYHHFRHFRSQRASFPAPLSHFDWQIILSILIGLQRQSSKKESRTFRNEFISFRELALDALLRGITLSWHKDSFQGERFVLLDNFIWETVCKVFTNKQLGELLHQEVVSIPKHSTTETVKASFSTLRSLLKRNDWGKNREHVQEIFRAITILKGHLVPPDDESTPSQATLGPKKGTSLTTRAGVVSLFKSEYKFQDIFDRSPFASK